MNTQKKTFLVFIFSLFSVLISFSQGEAKIWYFGNQAGLDFNTNPPTILTNNAIPGNWYSTAVISDAAGNLLFYSNGQNIWDKTHAIMANGSGLSISSNNGSQNVIIIKKPGSTTNYYVFHSQWNNLATAGLYYTEVNMSLAAGNGSVIAKNIPLAVITPSMTTGKLTATRHCNGTDIWVTGRDWQTNWNGGPVTTVTVNNSFRSFLVTSTGVNTTAVVSTPNTYTYSNNFSNVDWGCMKISPNGKKLAVALYGWNNNILNNHHSYELYDFDNTTGVVSNSLGLIQNTTTVNNYAWGVEFSPDGTKLYGSRYNNSVNGGLFQWDLCAGSNTAIAASIYTITNQGTNNFGTIQQAPNGKLYVARNNGTQQALDVINNPNGLGAACNYSPNAQSTAPRFSYWGLPNFMGSYFIQPPPHTPFTHTVSNMFGCQTASFNSIYSPTTVATGCAAQGYSLTNILWNFGDPSSGVNNTSTQSNPSHAYTTLGTYTAQLILYYSCGGGTDTIKQVVNVNQPCISVNSTSITCANLGSATVQATGGIGPFSYTWTPTGQTNSVATGLSPGSYTLTVFDFGNNFTYTASTTFNSLIPLVGQLNVTSSLACNSVNSGTANYTNISGGSGTQNYLWTNGVTTYTVSNPSTLSAGVWSSTVSDGLTGCQINDVFFISQPPPMTLNLSSSTATSCVGTNIVLTGTNSGGTAGYTYTWTSGPPTDSHTVSAAAGTHIYTLQSQDANNCLISNTISVTFVGNPTITIQSSSICPLETGTITALGASSYTWQDNSTTSSFAFNPTLTSTYTVVGTAQSCSSTAIGTITIKPIPQPTLQTNSPRCNGQNLSLSATGGTAYTWTGVNSFTSNLQNNTFSNANPSQSGAYQLTVTAANSCTASTTITLTVHPTPSISATGATVCSTQNINLTGNSVSGANYYWLGPNNYSSSQQNPVISPAIVSASGDYTLRATSLAGCINTSVANVTVTQAPQINTNGSDTQKCEGDNLQLNANSNAANVNFSWNGPNGFFSNQQNPQITSITPAASGVYALSVSYGPCTVNAATQAVTIHPLPTGTIISNSPVCETKRLTYQAQSPNNIVTYLWQIPNGFPQQTFSAQRDTSKLNYSGNYTLTLTDNHTCRSVIIASLHVLPNPSITVVGDTVCYTSPAEVSATGADSYMWYNATGVFSTNDKAVITSANFTTATIYTVVAKSANTCTTLATATVMTRPLPIPSIAVQPQRTLCANSQLTFEGSGATFYQWEGPNKQTMSGKKVSFLAANMSYNGVYTLTAIDTKGCQSKTTTNITLYNLPQGIIQNNKTQGCVPLISTAKFSTDVKTTTWYLNKKRYSDSAQITLNLITAGEYVLEAQLRDTNACVNTVTLQLSVYKQPKADYTFSPEVPVENTDEVQFTNLGKEINTSKWQILNPNPTITLEDNYQTGWTMVKGEISSKNQHPSYLFKEAGIYPVVLINTSKEGCSDTVVKTIKVEADFNVYIPNTFTPNDDGNNEYFLPITRGVKLYELMIFNRWGKKIFETNDPTKGWDGTYQGQACKQEVYIWKLIVSANNGQQKQLSGEVLLVR